MTRIAEQPAQASGCCEIQAQRKKVMKLDYSPSISAKSVTYQTISIDGLNIAYREAGDPASPKLVLLHGFPSSSHQYRNLIPALADRFHVIAPDYPGFGNSDHPDPAKFPYTFDHLAEVIAHFLERKGFDRFGLFAQDYGGPVGFRIITARPEKLEWLIDSKHQRVRSGLYGRVGRLARRAVAPAHAGK